MNKRGLSQASLLRLPICFFPGREKAKWFRVPICFFRGREKAKWFRLPFCFFPGVEKAKYPDFQFAFSGAGKKQNVQTSNLLFPNPGKSKMVQASNLLFPNPEKSKMVQTSNLLPVSRKFAFSRPGKKQNAQTSKMYQPSSLEPGLETRSACGARAHDLLLMSLAPYPLDYSSLKNLLLPGFPKANWMSNLLFRLKLPICFFPGRKKAKWFRLQKAQSSNSAFSRGGKKQNGQDFQFTFS